MNYQNQAKLIEAQVIERKTSAVGKAIPHFLKVHGKGKPELLFQACDWYRRLGLYDRAYQLLKLEKPLIRCSSTQSIEGRRLLWAARLLNLMGATEFALNLVGQIQPETYDDRRVLGTIHLNNFDYERASSHFVQMSELDPDPTRYVSRLSLLNLADARSGLNDREGAIRVAEDIFNHSTESLLRGIALQAKGEYQAREGNTREALQTLIQAKSFFPKGDLSPDYGLLMKWLGYAHAKEGYSDSAIHEFEVAIGILRTVSLRPEAWLDILRLKAEVGLLDPIDSHRLHRFPGLAAGFRSSLANIPPQKSIENLLKERTAWTIALGSNEYWQNNHASLGIPSEILLLAYLKLAGEWGLPLVRLLSLLWPEEVYSFLYLENRLHQLIHRLRHRFGIIITINNKSAWLANDSLIKIQVTLKDEDNGRPSIFKNRMAFSRIELEKFYNISHTPAWKWIRHWIELGWLRQVTKGKGTYYEIENASK